MNPRLQSWFDAGKIKEALIGDEEFFMPDSMYRDRHDTILAVGELAKWGNAGRRDLAGNGFSNAFASLVARGDCKRAIQLLLSYHVLRQHNYCEFEVKTGAIDAGLEQLVLKAQPLLNSDDEFRGNVLRVLEWHPAARRKIGL